MKKITTVLLGLFVAGAAMAQDGDFKKFKFGLKLDPSINWLAPDDAKKLQSGGSGVGFGFGAQGDIYFAEKFALSIGAGMSFENTKLNFTSGSNADSVYYATDADDNFVEYTDTGSYVNGYLLKNRTYRNNFFYVPVVLKMKTKEIGMMSYYGQFGADIRIKTKTRVDDEATNFNGEDDPMDLDYSKGTAPLNIGLNIGFGTEYNISGSTNLFGSISFHYGATNVLKKNDDYSFRYNPTTWQQEQFEQVATMRGLRLTVGVLF